MNIFGFCDILCVTTNKEMNVEVGSKSYKHTDLTGSVKIAITNKIQNVTDILILRVVSMRHL